MCWSALTLRIAVLTYVEISSTDVENRISVLTALGNISSAATKVLEINSTDVENRIAGLTAIGNSSPHMSCGSTAAESR